MNPKDIVYMAVAALIAAVLLPIAIGTIANTTTTKWSASTVVVFAVVLPILILISVALKFLGGTKGD